MVLKNFDLRTSITIYTFQISVILLVFAGSGKKDENDSNAGIPVLTTTPVTEITQTSAFSGGTIISNGGTSILSRGVCWSKGQTPTNNDSKTTDGTGPGTFESTISGLTANTTYYVRAYATNSKGTGYGNTKSFTTQDSNTTINSFTDPRDGNVYHMVTIGTQVWMVENLRYLPSVSDPATGSIASPCYYVYNYFGTDVIEAKATFNYNTYGVLYNWPAAKLAAPAGWHLPTDAEWTQLVNYSGGEQLAGGKLKETGTKHWDSPNTGATNITGFTALPGGIRDVDGKYAKIGLNGMWWSATAYFSPYAWCRDMGWCYSNVITFFMERESGFSVRCIKD